MVAELGCKQVGSSGCQLEYWHGLLTLQPLVCSFSMFVWFPICWRSNVSHQRNGNNEKDRDRIPHRPAEYEQCLRTRRKTGYRAACDGPAAEVDQKLVYPGAGSVVKTERHEGMGKAWHA